MNAIAEQLDILSRQYDQLTTRFDPESGVMWAHMNPKPLPCFTHAILADMREHQTLMERSGGVVALSDGLHCIDFLVLASQVRGVFNLGGDLRLFRELINQGDREGLFHYAEACIDVVYRNVINYNLPLTTIALIQGDALGGGLEAALSCDVVIAERSAQMGLPEVLFNLFPGMGAYSLMARRLGMKKAEEIILSGRIYTAAELHEIGLVDVLAEDGAGEFAVQEYVKNRARRRNAMRALAQVRQRLDPITYDELTDISRIWVDAAFRLEDRDLRIMDRLIRAQQKFARLPEFEPARAAA